MALAQRIASAGAGRQGSELLDATETETALTSRLLVNERSLKKVYADALAVLKGSDEEDRKLTLATLQVDLMGLGVSIKRQQLISSSTCPTELQDYENELRALHERHAATEAEIKKLQQELVEAQKERSNKLEYDALAKEIARYPTRAETEETIQRIHDQTQRIQEESEGYRDIALHTREGYVEAMKVFGGLQSHISSEIAEKERKAVERSGSAGEDDGDEGDDANQEAGKAGRDATAEDEGREEGEGRGRKEEGEEGEEEEGAMPEGNSGERSRVPSGSLLNPSATPFLPGSQSASGKRSASGIAIDEEEDGAVDDVVLVQSKRVRRA